MPAHGVWTATQSRFITGIEIAASFTSFIPRNDKKNAPDVIANGATL